MRRRTALGAAAASALLVVGVAGAAPPPPQVTVDEVTQHSVTLGSLSCDSRYRLRVQVYVDDVLSETTALEATTDACPVPPPPPPEPPPAPPPPPGVGDQLPPLLGPSLGTSLYVATTGTDQANNCQAIDRPCRTIAQAEQHVQPGNTIYVREGTYTGNLIINQRGTSSQPITFRNYPGERVVLHAFDDDMEMVKIDCNSRFLRIQGFIFEATPQLWTGTGHQALGIYGSSCGAEDIEIRRNFFEGFDKGSTNRHDLTPTLAGPRTLRVHYIGNVVRHWGPGTDSQRQGIYFQGSEGLIANNIVFDGLHGFGIQVRGVDARTFCNNVIVTGNTVVEWPSDSTGGGRGIAVEDTCRGVRLRNNISAFAVSSQEELYGIDGPATDPPASSNRAFTNLVWDGSTNRCGNTNNHEILDFTDGQGVYESCGDNLESDPLFTDRANGDFHLLPGSAAIDAADPHWALPFDFNGFARVGPPDIGAYEFGQ